MIVIIQKVPSKTACFPGAGLVDGLGKFQDMCVYIYIYTYKYIIIYIYDITHIYIYVYTHTSGVEGGRHELQVVRAGVEGARAPSHYD